MRRRTTLRSPLARCTAPCRPTCRVRRPLLPPTTTTRPTRPCNNPAASGAVTVQGIAGSVSLHAPRSRQATLHFDEVRGAASQIVAGGDVAVSFSPPVRARIECQAVHLDVHPAAGTKWTPDAAAEGRQGWGGVLEAEAAERSTNRGSGKISRAAGEGMYQATATAFFAAPSDAATREQALRAAAGEAVSGVNAVPSPAGQVRIQTPGAVGVSVVSWADSVLARLKRGGRKAK